jgi:hypothetical protein
MFRDLLETYFNMKRIFRLAEEKSLQEQYGDFVNCTSISQDVDNGRDGSIIYFPTIHKVKQWEIEQVIGFSHTSQISM